VTEAPRKFGRCLKRSNCSNAVGLLKLETRLS
jgi:hypothetical protein